MFITVNKFYLINQSIFDILRICKFYACHWMVIMWFWRKYNVTVQKKIRVKRPNNMNTTVG